MPPTTESKHGGAILLWSVNILPFGGIYGERRNGWLISVTLSKSHVGARSLGMNTRFPLASQGIIKLIKVVSV